MGFEWLSPKPYKRHYICINCRKGFKRPAEKDIISSESQKKYQPTCPQCQQEMTQVSYTFEVPKNKDKKAWKNLEERYKKNE